jgi:hypothetical protein
VLRRVRLRSQNTLVDRRSQLRAPRLRTVSSATTVHHRTPQSWGARLHHIAQHAGQSSHGETPKTAHVLVPSDFMHEWLVAWYRGRCHRPRTSRQARDPPSENLGNDRIMMSASLGIVRVRPKGRGVTGEQDSKRKVLRSRCIMRAPRFYLS